MPHGRARALKSVFRRVIRRYEFDPAAAVNGPDGSVLIDTAEVESALER